MRARRLIPQLLMVVLTAGAGVGAWVGVRDEPRAGGGAGVAGSSARSSFVERAVADTVRAGSATFEIAGTANGSGPDIATSDFGVGEVNFARHASEVNIYTHQTDRQSLGGSRQVPYSSYLHIRQTSQGTFVQIQAASPSVELPWMKAPATLLPGPFRSLSETYVGGALLNFLYLKAQPVPRFVGHQTLIGLATTVYAWSSHATECYGSGGRYSQQSSSEVRAWLDRQGRLRKVETTIDQESSSPKAPVQRIDTTDELVFTSFGSPVSIATPTVPQGLSRAGIAISRADKSTPCPSR